MYIEDDNDLTDSKIHSSPCFALDYCLGWHNPLNDKDNAKLAKVKDTRPIKICLSDFIGVDYDTLMRLNAKTLPWRNIYIDDIEHLPELFVKFKPKAFLVHINILQNNNGVNIKEFIEMINCLSKITTNKIIHIGVVFTPTTPYSIILELHSCGIRTLIPSVVDYDMSEVMPAIDASMNNQEYWPKHLIIQLPKSKSSPGEIKLTPRQVQVHELICTRGLSNKQIAKELSVSESVIKLHVQGILKKYRLKTRCQLSAYSNNQ
jgi:DNA-binding NarL/FixJ family response regulator